VNGNDANAGFSDVSSAAAGAVAKKTISAIGSLIPPNGAGRVGSLIIANGGVNTVEAYADSLPFLAMLSGYQHFDIVATGTNPNAGAVAFDGTANTQTYAGGITVPGLNVTGYNPTGAPTTTIIQMVLNGGGAPAIPAEPAAPLGWRIRFDINTATVALRGICKAIVKVSGGDTVTVDTALGAVPAAGDVFYIEKAGVLLTTPFVGVGTTATENFTLAGLDFTAPTSLFVYAGSPCFMFCGCNGLIGATKSALINVKRISPIAIAGGTINRACGGGLRNAGTYGASEAGTVLNLTCFTSVGLVEVLSSGGGNSISDANTFGGGLVIQGNYGDTNWNDAATALGGLTAGFPCRYIAAGANVGFTCGLQLRGCRLQLRNNDFQNMGAHPAIQVVGMVDIVMSGTQSGSTGNTDVGLDLTQGQGSRIYIRALPTVTGIAGDVRLSDGTIITWAQAMAGVVDTSGNVLFGTGNSPLHYTSVAVGAVAVAITNAPAGSPAAPTRYVKIPDGAGGFYTFPSLT